MPPVSFVGSSYQLQRRKADVQRVVNMMPVTNEVAGSKSVAYLDSVPGLTIFSEPVDALGSTRFFAIDEALEAGDVPPYTGLEPKAARDAFLAALSDYEIETCEGLTHNTNNPALTFGSITATTQGMRAVADATDARPNGRFNTTVGGTKFIETRNDLTAGPAPVPTGKITFSSPISAFGAYIEDAADFASQLRIWANTSDGQRICMNLPILTDELGNSSLAFFGFISASVTFDSIEFAREDNYVAYDTDLEEYDNFNTDQVGLDDIIIATAAQLLPIEPATGYPDPLSASPNPWGAQRGFETLIHLPLDAVTGGNVFQNRGALADALYSPDQVGSAVDSASNSVADGTFVTETGMGACYACIGERLTFQTDDFQPSTLFFYRAGFEIDFTFKRSGSRVGTGELLHVPNLLTLACDASHNLVATLTVTNFPIPGSSTRVLTTSTPLPTAVTKVRVMYHLRDTGGGGITYELRGAIFFDGVMVARGDSYLTGGWSSESIASPGYVTVGDGLIGSKDGSNYTPGFIKQFAVSNTCRGLFEDYTPQTGPITEIYPPGMYRE